MKFSTGKIKTWWRNFFRKRRINLLNARTNREEWHILLSPASIFAAFVALVLLLFIVVLLLVAYTPLLDILPGYRTEAARARIDLARNIVRIDSMERVMGDMMTYNQNIALIMEGKTPTTRIVSAGDSAHVSKILVMPSPADSVLRAQMEDSTGIYSLSQNTNTTASVRQKIEFVKPIDGTILNGFDIKNGLFGIRIAADANARVVAVEQGTVILNIWAPDTGRTIALQHGDNLISVYRGLSDSPVHVGQVVKAGDLVGYTADAMQNGDMKPFEFELWSNGNPVDPASYIVF